MGIIAIFIVNRAGSLLFYGNYGDGPKLPSNESLRLASIWHGYVLAGVGGGVFFSCFFFFFTLPFNSRRSISAIAGQLSPATDSSGITEMEVDTFRLYSYITLTGTIGGFFKK